MDELLGGLTEKSALIVHCSRPGKQGDPEALPFPDDLLKAMDGVQNSSRPLCCSVVWPAQQHTFGTVGIVLRPRSVNSIMNICPSDGGTRFNELTGELEGFGEPFSKEAVLQTFAASSGHNEWNVRDADVVGGFFNFAETPPLVPERVDMAHQVADYDEALHGVRFQFQPRSVQIDEVIQVFAPRPVFAFFAGRLACFGADPAMVYR